MQVLRNNSKAAVIAFGIFGRYRAPVILRRFSGGSLICPQWRYQAVPDAPPSWENDYGRPDMNGGRKSLAVKALKFEGLF